MDTNETTQTEKVFYEDKFVKVTQSRFISNGSTHAMRNISSVSNQHIPNSIGGSIMLIVIGIIVAFFGSTALIVGLILIGIAIALIATTKDDYAVKISSNSGQSNVVISKDKKYIQTIVNAINEAIIHRG